MTEYERPTDEALMELALKDPWLVASIALSEADETEPSEDRNEAFRMAAAHMAVRQLVELGCDLDAVLRNFETRPWTAQFAYEPETEQLTVAIEWGDGANPPEMRPPT